MSELSAESVDRIVAFVRDGDRNKIAIADIVGLADLMADSFKDIFQAEAVEAYSDFISIADAISTMKADISELSASDIALNRIPTAGRELDAIVEATEAATNTIMESAEAMLGLDPDMDALDYRNAVEGECMKLFEACSFQDITGQRVTKVVETLQHIETRVARFSEAMGLKGDDAGTLTDEEEVREQRKRDLILHGPQLEGDGIEQTDIDALLFDLDTAEENADLPSQPSSDIFDAVDLDSIDFDSIDEPAEVVEPSDVDRAVAKLTGTDG